MQQDILYKPLSLHQFSGHCHDLIKRLLEKDPAKRLGATRGIKEIIDHPFFAEISWDDVRNHSYKYDKMAFMKLDLLASNFNTDHI